MQSGRVALYRMGIGYFYCIWYYGYYLYVWGCGVRVDRLPVKEKVIFGEGFKFYASMTDSRSGYLFAYGSTPAKAVLALRRLYCYERKHRVEVVFVPVRDDR